MAVRDSKTAGRIATLKRKLRGPQGAGGVRTKRPTTTDAAKKQRAKALVKAFGVDDRNGLRISQASTKHTAGRRDVCRSLDRTAADAQVGEALRGIGEKPVAVVPTVEDRAQMREKAAQEYEHHQMAVDQTVDELAQLMSGA